MNCSFCQAPLLPQSNYCSACGKSVDIALVHSADKEKKRYRKFAFIVAVFFAAYVFIFWMVDLVGYFSHERINLTKAIPPLAYLITLCFYSVPLFS
ncbi:MAG: zinc ribbon domain-containing protein, partial [Bacteroidia bacterium]|nr:zinc ribbon domain-containing protein [Bacteroidia bacterium]